VVNFGLELASEKKELCITLVSFAPGSAAPCIVPIVTLSTIKQIAKFAIELVSVNIFLEA
jgi:hypothetical protein